MSLKKLELKYKQHLDLLDSLSKVSTPDIQLIKQSLKLTNEFQKIIGSIRKSKELKKNAEWIKNREEGKIQRKSLTDAIKAFIEYAKINGSLGADKYYMNVTKMQNSALGSLNRDAADLFTLNAFQMSDVIIANVLKSGIEKGLYYKEVFKEAKKSVENFAKSVGLK